MMCRMLVVMFGFLCAFTSNLSASNERENFFSEAGSGEGMAYDSATSCQPSCCEVDAPITCSQPSCCEAPTTYSEPNCCEAYSPSTCWVSSCCNDGCGFRVYADLLYWRPQLCGLQGAFGDTTIATTFDENALITTTVRECDVEPHSKWDPGFRIGAGVTFNCFDLKLDWTHFDGHATFNRDCQDGHWKIKYDVIDLTIGRPFRASSCICLKPFFGLRVAEIHNKLESHLTTLFTSPLIGDTTVYSDKYDREHFCGIGPELGLDINWCIGCNFSLYGNFAVVGYYGDVKRRNCDTDTFTSSVSVCDGRQKHCFNNLATDAAIGIRWDSCSMCLCGCRLNWMVRLGVEQHRIYNFSDLGSDGDLSLDGGILGAGVNFSF